MLSLVKILSRYNTCTLYIPWTCLLDKTCISYVAFMTNCKMLVCASNVLYTWDCANPSCLCIAEKLGGKIYHLVLSLSMCIHKTRPLDLDSKSTPCDITLIIVPYSICTACIRSIHLILNFTTVVPETGLSS